MLVMATIQEQLKKLPDNPGIYLFYNTEKELIYVGKATSLKNRVKSYFIGKRYSRPIENMIHEVVNIKWKETDSVLEAVILESICIKKYQPKYNVLGKDNKSWNYIVITRDEYPRVETAREYELQQLTEAELKKNYLHIFGPYPGLNRRATMKLLARLFNLSFCKPNQDRPCLYYEMGQCFGVCGGKITAKEYKERAIKPLVVLLRGQKKRLLSMIEKRMKQAAKDHDYEEAARLRDQLAALYRIHDIALLNESFFEDAGTDKFVPFTPATISAEDRKTQKESNDLVRIEGYDISNLGATGKVGSMVVFVHGEPDKRKYRRFRIKTVEGQSDVDCLAEVLERRLNHVEWPLPVLFLIDGGKPQVNRAQQILRDRNIAVPVVGIAKGPERKRNDFIFGDTKTRDVIRWVSENQRLLIKVRDEAHRFAISYQRKIR